MFDNKMSNEQIIKYNKLVSEARDLTNDTETFKIKMAEIEKFQADTEEININSANKSAMNKTNTITDIYKNSTKIIGGKVMAKMNDNSFADKRSTDEYKESFVRTLQGNGTIEMNNLVTSTTGAAVIPTTTMDSIIQNVQKQQGLLSKIRILQIPGKLSIPVSGVNTASVWHPEGEAVADSSVVPTNLLLTGYELLKVFSLSVATQTMSINAYENYLTDELTRCTRDALNAAVFDGDGLIQPLGIMGLTYDATNSTTYAGAALTPIFDALITALGMLASNFRQGSCWIMNSKTFYTTMLAAKDEALRPIFAQDLSSGMPLSILGHSVIIDDFATDGCIILGNPQYYIINFSSPIQVEKSTESGFTSGIINYRALTVVDGKPVQTAFVKVTEGV